jgi:hypothetical protein
MSTKNGGEEQKWIINPEGHIESKLNGMVITYSSNNYTMMKPKGANLDKWSFVADNCGCVQCSGTELDRSVPDEEGGSCKKRHSS